MAGIYIHIPYCKKACHYCNFHFSTTRRSMDEMITALMREIDLRADYLNNQVVESIYFGGGTPSLLSIKALHEILNKINNTFKVNTGAEITLEANPDDINTAYLKNLKRTAVNRLSIGVQSFIDEDLHFLNRSHSALQAHKAIALARDIGFENISIDLIFGIQNRNLQQWQNNLEKAISLNIPHISCYALTIEPRTALHYFIRKQKIAPLNEEEQLQQMILTMNMLSRAGYEHYEVSNYAIPGFRAKHNSSYWNNTHYLGIGPSAHSFNGSSRQWNIANNAHYIKSIASGIVPFEREELSPHDRFNEYIMTSLRTVDGCDVSIIKQQFGQKLKDIFLQNIKNFIETGQVVLEGKWIYKLSQKGILIADHIISELFI